MASDITAVPHQGESFYELVIRIGRWLDTLRDAGNVIAVTHTSIVRAVIVQVLQGPPYDAFQRIEVEPLTVTEIRFSRDQWRVRFVGLPLS
jgi:broad specificity phosphatase PhoE